MLGRRMGLQHIETFRAVVMTGSMTKAAEQLHTSQPQVSRLIAQLEQITKFPLFIRRGTRITPSVEGSKFFEEVEKSFIGLASLETAAGNIRSFRSEHLRVAAMPRLAGGLLTHVVAALKGDLPETMISIHSGTASAVHSWVGSGICDVGLAMLYGDGISGVDVSPVMTSKCVCVLPAGHPLAELPQLTPRDFAGQDFITFSTGSSLRTQIDGFFRQAGVQPRVVAETDLGASACALVAAGVGVSLMNPMAAIEEALDARLVVRPVSPDLIVTLAVIFPPYRQRSRLTDRFEGYARDAIMREFGRFAATDADTLPA